jgi:hypothetical protein
VGYEKYKILLGKSYALLSVFYLQLLSYKCKVNETN